MLGTASDRLRYLSPSMQSLIAGLAAQYTELGFLEKCNAEMQNGISFTKAFMQALSTENMQKHTYEVLLSLLSELGQSDIDSQLAAIAYACERMREEIQREQSFCAVHCKLYRSLGALGGAALAILLL